MQSHPSQADAPAKQSGTDEKKRRSLRRRLSLGSSMLALVAIFSLLASGVAWADNVQNDVTVGGNDTFTAGGSTTVSYRIQANNGDGQNGCNAADSSPATVTINTPANVTATPGSLTFTTCGAFQSTVFTSATPGNYPITVAVSDAGVGTYNVNPASFTLKVLAPSDTTPPVISPTVTGTLGNNGWYTSDVDVSWSVTDAQSAISSTTGCGNVTISTDTAGQTITCSATSAGDTSSQSVTVKRDATAPTISGAPTTSPNGNGWYNAAVDIEFTCGDAMSGVASCGPDATLSGEGAAQSATGTAIDNAGNSAGTTVGGIDIDLTDPNVSLVGGPADGGSYFFGFVPSAPTCSASDALSGIDGTCAVTGYGSAVGSHTVTAAASDLAGNSASASASYTVDAWTLNGFFNPVDMGYLNTVKGGSTVPLKFRIFAGTTELTDVSYIKSLTAVTMTCPGTSMPVAPVEEIAPAGGTLLRYDATGGQFIYNWKTLKNPGKCYKVTMTALDGSIITADFKLT